MNRILKTALTIATLMGVALVHAQTPPGEIESQGEATYVDPSGAPQSVGSSIVVTTIRTVRGGSLSLVSDAPTPAAPGGRAVVGLTVRNVGNDADTFRLSLAPGTSGAGFVSGASCDVVPEGTPAATIDVALAAGADACVPLIVDVSVAASSGDLTIPVRLAYADGDPAAEPLDTADAVFAIGTDPVVNALIDAVATPTVVAPGDLIRFDVTVTNPSPLRLVGELDFLAPSGTRAVGADEPRTIETSLAPQLTVGDAGVAIDGGWQVPVEIAADGSIVVPYYARVLVGAPERLEATFVLASTFAGSRTTDAASVDVSVAVTVDPGSFARNLGVLTGSVQSIGENGESSPVEGARLLLPDGRQALTDANGRYAFRDVPTGWWRVQIDPSTVSGPLEPHAQLGDEPFARDVRVDGLTRLDLRVAAAATDPSSQTTADAMAATPDEDAATGPVRIVQPAQDVVVRDGIVPTVRIEAPTGDAIAVTLDGQPIADDLVAVRSVDGGADLQAIELVALPLQVGPNVLRAQHGETTVERIITVAGTPYRIELASTTGVADGTAPIVGRFLVYDRFGTLAGNGVATVSGDLALDERADAYPERPGVQVEVRDGVADVVFAPRVGGGRFDVEMRFAGLSERAAFVLETPDRTLWTAQAGLGARFNEGALGVRLTGRAYAEHAGEFGAVQFAADAGVDWTAAGGLVYLPGFDDADRDVYEHTGADAEATRPLASADGVAVRYQRGPLRASYEADAIAFEGIGVTSYGTAARAVVPLDDRATLEIIAGLLPDERTRVEITPDGTRRYPLDDAPVAGSQQLTLVRVVDGDVLDEEVLRPGVDYIVERDPAVLVLADPLWSSDADGADLLLVLEYANEEAPRDTIVAGATWRIDDGPGSAYASVAQLPHDGGTGLVTALGLSYDFGDGRLAADYESRSWESGPRIGVRADVSDGAWSAGLDARLGQATRGDASLGWSTPWYGVDVRGRYAWEDGQPDTFGVGARVPVLDIATLDLQHEWTGDTTASRALAQTTVDAWGVEAGVERDGSDPSWHALLGAAGNVAGFDVAVDHRQGLTATSTSSSGLELIAPIVPGTRLVVDAAYVWGGDTLAGATLRQTVGATTWDLGVRRNDDGDTAAMASVDAPIALSDQVRLDLAAGVENDLTGGTGLSTAVSAAAVYDADALSASFGVDLATDAAGTKLELAADATGRIDASNSLSARARLGVLPAVTGTVQLGYAYYGSSVALLVDQRLDVDGDTRWTGAADLAWRVTDTIDLRPRIAYRTVFGDPDASLVQAGFGAHAAATDAIAIGGVVYYAIQPTLGASDLAFGLEGVYRIDDALAVVLGYTFGDGPGLLSGGERGAYLRLDVKGGTR